MTSLRRTLLALGCSILVAPALVAGADATASRTGGPPAWAAGGAPQNDHIKAAEAAVQWQPIAVRTIWTETVPLPAPPVGSMYLSFTSLATRMEVLSLIHGKTV